MAYYLAMDQVLDALPQGPALSAPIALYVRTRRPRIPLAPLLHGGGHERGLRSGTLPVPLCVGFARAVELCLADLGWDHTVSTTTWETNLERHYDELAAQ